MSKKRSSAATFGRRHEPHTVIIASGDRIRHFTIRPWLAALAGCAVAAIAIGYLLATSYLVLRDDLLGATAARQARMQQAYEDRISMLRAQVDRITSRQLLDQQIVESKVAELMERQTQLTQRQGRLDPILDRASTLPVDGDVPLPQARPDLRAKIAPGKAVPPSLSSAFWSGSTKGETAADRADRVFVAINQSLRSIETEQIEDIEQLAATTFETADRIAEALQDAGLEVDLAGGEDATGGPLVPVSGEYLFETQVRELDAAVAKLEAVKAAARVAPIHNPVPGSAVTSSFGVRRDPILGRRAMHTGIDFRAKVGHAVLSAGAGTVVSAGWNGGYGRMVEIDHGDGYTTRYAHMSKIVVTKGDRVEAGDIVGKSGSSGRSTGPHLHFEVRREGDAIDPVRFLKAGKAVRDMI